MNLKHKYLAPLVVALGLTSVSAQAQTLFSNNFDSATVGADVTTIPGASYVNSAPGYSATISDELGALGDNSLKFTLDEDGEPSIVFALGTSITKDSPGITVAFDFARSTAFDPNIWMMFSGGDSGFAKGNFGIRAESFQIFWDTPQVFDHQYTGFNVGVWQHLEITYSNFTTDGTNITGWQMDFSTSGGELNPSNTFFATGVSFASFDSIRFQGRGVGTDVYFDNVSITAIPEPSAFAALAGLGALGLVSLRRRRAA